MSKYCKEKGGHKLSKESITKQTMLLNVLDNPP